MAKILLAGFMHETNTFTPHLTEFENFQQADATPAMCFGDEILSVMQDINLSSAGFIKQAQQDGHDIIGALWCFAPPHGIVTQATFERITNMISEYIQAGGYDAIYLDLHGAMVTEQHEDGEGALLEHIRSICGHDIPLVASLDLHANITETMLEQSDYLDVYRTYPHIDMYDTGVRCAIALNDILNHNKRYHKRLIKLPFIMPLNSQCTLIEPGRSIYDHVKHQSNAHTRLSVALGFPLADIFECGPAVLAYGDDEIETEKKAQACAQLIVDNKKAFRTQLYSADEAVAYAMAHRHDDKPIIICDTQDNSGGGASSDTTGLIKALIKAKAKNALVAMVNDPEAAKASHQAGIGSTITIALGGKSGTKGDSPLEATFNVNALSDGNFICTGPFYRGVHAACGLMALLSIDDIEIVVSSVKIQAADQMMIKHLGVDPKSKSILGLKSSVHFRADFAAIAAEIITAEIPGLCTVNLHKLPYQHIAADLERL